MSISRKTNKFLKFFQIAYVVLLIKQHTCAKSAHLNFHKQKKKPFELFQFLISFENGELGRFRWPSGPSAFLSNSFADFAETFAFGDKKPQLLKVVIRQLHKSVPFAEFVFGWTPSFVYNQI